VKSLGAIFPHFPKNQDVFAKTFCKNFFPWRMVRGIWWGKKSVEETPYHTQPVKPRFQS